MKKQDINFIITVGFLATLTSFCLSMPQYFVAPMTYVGKAVVEIAEPEYAFEKIKSKFSSYIPNEETNNTTTQSQDVEQVMNVIGSKDSDDDSDITKTPDDILSLMKSAEGKYTKSNALGKTSEEPYQGGGTIISYGDLQIQSKIPSSVYSPNIEALLLADSDLVIKDKSKPTILVYHSHTTEAYSLVDSGFYIKSDSRSKNVAKNMVRVGDELVRYLEQAGFVVIHDREIHDKDYNSSYDSSRETVEKYLEEYPSIEITIDVHRDDITYSNKTKVKPTIEINGKKAARMMLISGCEYNRVKNFPDWEYNLRFDLQVQSKVNQLYPQLMRPILFSERKYNMYETHNSFLLEIGTDANTLDEACYSARMFGKAFGELLNEKYVAN